LEKNIDIANDKYFAKGFEAMLQQIGHNAIYINKMKNLV
jgi:hypothetical protein